MGMARVVLADGSSMTFKPDIVDIEDEHLVFKERKLDSKPGLLAMFAPGQWKYWYWIRLGGRQ